MNRDALDVMPRATPSVHKPWHRRTPVPEQAVAKSPYWAKPASELFGELRSRPGGLSSSEALLRLAAVGPNTLASARRFSRMSVLFDQVRSPLLLLLVFAAAMSAFSGEWIDAFIVLSILMTTVAIGFRREYRAQLSAALLQSRLKTRAQVVREGQVIQLPTEQLVPGDVVLLAAGSLVPADCIVLEARDCHVSEAVLTGESYPVLKRPGTCASDAPLARRANCVYLGTNVRSGSARCLVVATGPATMFGEIAGRLVLRPPETEFARGVRHFGYLLTSVMLIFVLVVFAAHALRGRPALDTLLFSIALAVGLSPELLPAILSISLSRAAELMAAKGVLVRRLSAIENLGSMDVLCTDKTGTLTEGVVRLEGAYGPDGVVSSAVLALAACNAALETGLPSPLDDAIVAASTPDLTRVSKLAEIPFDFTRKRVSVVVRDEYGVQLIMKGAFEHVVTTCSECSGQPLTAAVRAELTARFRAFSERGVRVLAVACRRLPEQESYERDAERDLTFSGFLTFLDRPKPGAREAIAALSARGISVKLITGDNRFVAHHVAQLVGLCAERSLIGSELDKLHDEALWREAERTDVFAEVDPNQKERLILALKKTGHVVGFLGDGVNDAPAMHAADTSLSVDGAVDVAREAADFVLLERDLDVIRRGVDAGRKTFANTLKYILTTISANFGNMLSMAFASMFLPFLPLLAGQILLNNFLSDIPAFGVVDDHVDPELLDKPRRWDMPMIGRFMVQFGLLSSFFDVLTFVALLWLFHASDEVFRTGWFVASLLTELVIALIVRTRRPFYRSRPGAVLLGSTVVLIPLTYAIPYLPFASVLGFVPVPFAVLAAITAITGCYVVAAELAKRHFYRRAAR